MRDTEKSSGERAYTVADLLREAAASTLMTPKEADEAAQRERMEMVNGLRRALFGGLSRSGDKGAERRGKVASA